MNIRDCDFYKTVAIGKVRDFYGVLYDLNNVAGNNGYKSWIPKRS